MKKKSKGETIDLLYTNKTEQKKKTKNKSSKTKKTTNSKKDTRINLDNEIIIGLTPRQNTTNTKKEKTKKQITKNKEPKAQNKKQTKPKSTPKKAKSTKQKTNKKKSKNNKVAFKVIKWTSIVALIIIAVTLFMMSSIFNIKQIVVTNNKKISSQEIISISGVKTGINMFKITNRSIRKAIKTNPYIENIVIRRNVNGVITLEVEERVATYMLKFANAYVYINNQGYMLEIAEEPLELPVITGFETPAEEINEGSRLIIEDLKKLEDVIRITKSAKSNSLADIITEIDITDSTNYILTIASESKTVQFGDISNVNVKLLKIEELIEQEKGVAGEIYFQGTDKTIFKEEVKR